MALSSILIPPDAARDAKARELLATEFHVWHLGELKQPWGSFEVGTGYFITRNGYTCNTVFCSCPDYKRGHICKHVRCVVMADAQIVTKPKRIEDLMPTCQQPRCQNDPARAGERYCSNHWLMDF